MSAKQFIYRSVFCLLGAALFLLLNFGFIEHLLIPDPCYYHSHEPGLVFRIFYDLPASEGYHPLPTWFNLLITMGLGAYAGYIFSAYSFRTEEVAA
jgi:hypothetical protein